MLPFSLALLRLSPRPLLRRLLACSLVCCVLASDKIEKRYEFSSNTIDSQLIMPDAPLFTLFELAPSANLYRAKSSVIVEKFKQHNITLIPTSTIVEFVRTQNDRMPFLEEKIGPLFVDEYAKYHILVQDVIVTPLNNVALDGLHFQDFQFPQKLQKRARQLPRNLLRRAWQGEENLFSLRNQSHARGDRDDQKAQGWRCD
ncbi:MAG: hypothetical protein K2N54_02620 [Helicobacter sp.]|nr:hypothetical protein [Helicobacter sp.]